MRFALFDLDGTLVDRRSAFPDAIAQLSADHGYGPEIERWLIAQLSDRADHSDFERLRVTFQLNESADHLWRVYVDHMAAAITCRPEVLEGLAELRAADWTIGIVSNGASDIQRAKLAATGIADLVDGVAVSGDLDVRKPGRELFAFAAALCGLNLTDGGWMIGDDPAADIGGGHMAGLRTIWVRGRPWPDLLPAPHRTVDDVTDAITILLNERQ
ncbi:HAD family hydrolase [Streptomyces sp. NPDC021562]|uniref:HAD family hydrolase n=1 Tax=Streptomyces sp. NPDC021562 TaxID=3155121 RepID=UPI0033C664BA